MKNAIVRLVTLSFTALLVVFVVIATATPASAQQTRTFLYIDGIQGESTDVNHKDWIEILSLRQSYPSPANTAQPQNNRVGTSMQYPCSIEIVKPLDRSGPKLWEGAVMGKHYKEAEIDVTEYSEVARTIYKIRLEEVMVSSITTYGGAQASIGDLRAGQGFAETVILVGGRLELTYWIVNPDGATGGQVVAKLDCK